MLGTSNKTQLGGTLMSMWSFPPIPSYPGTQAINRDPNLRFNPRFDPMTGFSFGTVQNPYLNFLFNDVNQMQTGIFNTFGGPGFGY